ncbi:MAG: PTS sugar transporter subunit IIC, partial [Firmicutes bacterium]|nr:PTS sugar transporter subunit IIC [Bacillota bacterium]
AGMGTSGLVGQIMTLTDMGFSGGVLFKILIVQIILPALFAYLTYAVMRRAGIIKDGDLKLDL